MCADLTCVLIDAEFAAGPLSVQGIDNGTLICCLVGICCRNLEQATAGKRLCQRKGEITVLLLMAADTVQAKWTACILTANVYWFESFKYPFNKHHAQPRETKRGRFERLIYSTSQYTLERGKNCRKNQVKIITVLPSKYFLWNSLELEYKGKQRLILSEWTECCENRPYIQADDQHRPERNPSSWFASRDCLGDC